MNIVTITLNPAIDQTILVNDFCTNAVNRVEGMQLDPGGKGVNVASFLADFGIGMTVTGLLGDENPKLFEKLFVEKNIDDQFLRIPGNTRTNIKIMDAHKQQTTDINSPGEIPPAWVVDELESRLLQLSDRCDWFVFSGNLPPGVPAGIYERLIRLLKGEGKHTVLDTSREALAAGLKACPDIVKPNIDELRQITGLQMQNLSEVEKAARQIQAGGVGIVVVSMGKDGALFVDGTQSFMAVPPSVVVKTTVGAGDAMVAGLVAGKSQGFRLEECARLATAFSLSAISSVGANLPERSVLDRFLSQVVIKPFDADNRS